MVKKEIKKTEAPVAEEEIEVKIEAPKEEEKAGEESAEKKNKKEVEAIMHIYTSYNNTIVHLTDAAGKTIAKVTGGMVTKQDRLKANPTVAMFIAKRIAEEIKELGITSLNVRIRAATGQTSPGPGANAIVKSLTRSGFRVTNILDLTRSPRGGPKIGGGRRGRRV